ncbi:uncharacterized protein EDB91DRAFT_260347 [Suillus paluster]|uniref:uncharacterized protein n=1 Tax=Suillus paluster TaxID=48578 RepID=UPI001B87838E|nr:uncharacterized protein EDB91DRAFT_260347 [Suillus paluster]KAG1754931.1 hypothetical protein EDB91DRAFT_260347 [Suillus paluster]
MPPPLNHPCLELELLDQTFFVKQLPVDAGVPATIVSGLAESLDILLHSLSRLHQRGVISQVVFKVTPLDNNNHNPCNHTSILDLRPHLDSTRTHTVLLHGLRVRRCGYYRRAGAEQELIIRLLRFVSFG